MNKCIKSVIFILTVIILITGLSGCDKEDTINNENTTKIESKINKEDNIKVEALGVAANGDFVFKLTNKNNEPVYIEKIDVIFKDEKGNFMKREEGYIKYFTIGSKAESVSFVDGFGKSFSEYKNYEFKIKTSEESMKDNYIPNGIEGKITPNNTAHQLAVTIKNNTNSEINWIKLIAVYYKDGQVVGCKTGSSDDKLMKGEETYINIYYPNDFWYNRIEFDDYEVYLIQAKK